MWPEIVRNAQKNGEAVGPVGGETGVLRFLAMVRVNHEALAFTLY